MLFRSMALVALELDYLPPSPSSHFSLETCLQIRDSVQSDVGHISEVGIGILGSKKARSRPVNTTEYIPCRRQYPFWRTDSAGKCGFLHPIASSFLH